MTNLKDENEPFCSQFTTLEAAQKAGITKDCMDCPEMESEQGAYLCNRVVSAVLNEMDEKLAKGGEIE